jgi:hypothetical protein
MTLGIDVPPFRDWFSPFNSSRVVHPCAPYAETSSSASVAHNLYRRLGEDEIHPSCSRLTRSMSRRR